MNRNAFCLLLIYLFAAVSCSSLDEKEIPADAVKEKAVNYYLNGNFAEAETLLLQVLEKYKMLSPQGKHPEYADSLHILARVYHDMGNLSKAETLYNQALDICRALPAEDKGSLYTTLLNDLAGLYDDMGNFNKAENLYLQAIEIKKALPPAGQNPGYALSLNNLAALYLKKGEYKKAEPLLFEALDIRKNFSPAGMHPDYIETLINLAGLYHYMGNYRQAEPLYLQALDILKKHLPENKYPNYAAALNNLGELYRNMGNYEEAESYYLQALDIVKTAPPEGKNPHYAQTLNNLADLYSNMGEYYKAEPFYLQAIDIVRVLPPEGHHYLYALLQNNLAQLYEAMGNYPKAEALYLKAVAIFKFLPPEGQHPDYAQSLNTLAGLYCKIKDYSKAETLYRQALDILKNLSPEGQHPVYAISLQDLAVLYQSTGKFSEAGELYLQALDIFKHLPPEGKHPRYAKSLCNMALLQKTLKNYPEAEALYLQALEIRGALPPAGRHPDYAFTLSSLALFYEAAGKDTEAEQALLKSLAVYREFFHSNFFTMSEKEKEYFLAVFAERFEYFYSFLEKRFSVNPELAATAADLQLFTRALLLRSAKAIRTHLKKNAAGELIRDYDAWLTMRRQINKAYELTREQRAARQINLEAWEEEAGGLEKNLIAGSDEFRQIYGAKSHTWQEIRSALQPGEAALDLVRYRQHNMGWTDNIRYAAILIKADSPRPEIVFMKEGNLIEKEIIPLYRNFISETANNPVAMRDTGTLQTLYTYLWEPLAAELSDIHRIYFSPDGMFHLINPATLQNSSGKWVGEIWEIIRVTSLNDLLEKPRDRYEAAGPPLLIGCPLYSIDEETYLKAVTRFVPDHREAVYEFTWRAIDSLAPLPGSRAEVEKLAAMLKQKGWHPEIRLQEAALEECVKAAKSPRILHLATHAFFQEDLTHKAVSYAAGEETWQPGNDPMLHSGLLLSGVVRNHTGIQAAAGLENGILTAREILDLDLQNTELVVLSACETGLGMVKNDEGVYGLQRAFFVAGAGAVLMSLWKVDDRASCDFMVEFYRNWLSGQNKQDAFRQTVTWMKRKYPAVFYWGAFILVGR